MTIGERIYYCRTENHMTQKQLAEKCGMADSAIRKYESGKITPKFETVLKIAAALGVEWVDLYPDPHAASKAPRSDRERVTDASDEYGKGALHLETSAKENARRLFYELPDDWHRGTAVNWQIEILHRKMGNDSHSAMFEALMQLYQDNELFSQELEERLETLVCARNAPQEPPTAPP